jgi:hypothetical protein
MAQTAPKKIQQVLRYVLGGLTALLLLYGVFRFSFVSVPPDFGWADFTPGDRLVVDGFPSHGREFAPDDFVTFLQEGEEGPTLGRLVATREGDRPAAEEVRDFLRKRLGRSITIDEARFLLREAAGSPRAGDWLVAVAVKPEDRWNLYLEWVPPDRLKGRVIVRSPF